MSLVERKSCDKKSTKQLTLSRLQSHIFSAFMKIKKIHECTDCIMHAIAHINH